MQRINVAHVRGHSFVYHDYNIIRPPFAHCARRAVCWFRLREMRERGAFFLWIRYHTQTRLLTRHNDTKTRRRCTSQQTNRYYTLAASADQMEYYKRVMIELVAARECAFRATSRASVCHKRAHRRAERWKQWWMGVINALLTRVFSCATCKRMRFMLRACARLWRLIFNQG